MYKIVICDDEGKTTLIPFSRTELSIGREEGNTIRLTDRNVSRRHARLFRKGRHTFFVEDFGGRNHTRVDGTELEGEVREVQLEERIAIGDYKLSVSKKEYGGIPLGVQVDPKVDKGVGKVTSNARIVMLEGPTPGMEVDLEEELYIIGRSDRANINIDDPSISRAHARIEGSEEHWTISDLDSINGIYINGEKKDDYLLKAGDRIDFGKIQFRYVAGGEPYDFESSKGADKESTGDDERDVKTTVIRLLVVLVLAGMLGLWLVMRMDVPEETSPTRAVTRRPVVTFDGLVEDGRAKMEAKQWEEAAKLFAHAQKINSDSPVAKELKRKANLEVEAKAAVDAALQARDDQEWQVAAEELAKIPGDSYYYSLSFIVEVGDKLCDELIYKADVMISNADPEAATLLTTVGEIPQVTDECLAKRASLEERLKELVPGAPPE